MAQVPTSSFLRKVVLPGRHWSGTSSARRAVYHDQMCATRADTPTRLVGFAVQAPTRSSGAHKLYLAEIGSIGSGLYEERLVFADAVLVQGLLVSCLVGHLSGERTGQEQVAGRRVVWHHSWVFTSAWLFCDLPGKSLRSHPDQTVAGRTQ